MTPISENPNLSWSDRDVDKAITSNWLEWREVKLGLRKGEKIEAIAGELEMPGILPEKNVVVSGLFAYPETLTSRYEDSTGLATLARPLFDLVTSAEEDERLKHYSKSFGIELDPIDDENGRPFFTMLTHRESRTIVNVMNRSGDEASAHDQVLGALMVLPVDLLKLARDNGVLIFSPDGIFPEVVGVPRKILQLLKGENIVENKYGTNGGLSPHGFGVGSSREPLRKLFDLGWKPVVLGCYAGSQKS